MPTIFPNGLGLTAGGKFAGKPLYTTGLTAYVHHTGSLSNNGFDRQHPLPTMAAGFSAISGTADSKLVLMEGHAEEVTGNLSLNQRVKIVGEGYVNGRPSVEITLAAGTHSALIFASPSDGSWVENIRFMPPGNAAVPGANSGFQVNLGTRDNVRLIGCDFYLDQHIDGAGVTMQAAANMCRIENCIFLSTETSTTPANRPAAGMTVTGALAGLIIENTTFDGGTVGFTGNAFDASAGAITDLNVIGLSLLRGSDFVLAATTVGDMFGPLTLTGSSRIVWP